MKKILIILTILFCYTSISYAVDPYLDFSDIVQGPATGIGDGLGSGAIVTIWGTNLGSSQGTSKVYFTDSGSTKREAVHIYYWCNADGGTSGGGPADKYDYGRMQEIAFSIPDSATGAGTITVEVGGVSSNALPFTVRAGNIYYVKSIGNDSTGDGSWANPWLTVSYDTGTPDGALSKVSAGDIIYIGSGVETSNIVFRTGVEGTSGNDISVISYPGSYHIVSVDNATGIGYPGWSSLSPCTTPPEYINFSKIKVISNNTGIVPSKYGRVIGCEVTDNTCAQGVAAAIPGAHRLAGGQVLLGNWIHDWGGSCNTDNLEHVTYNTNRCGSSISAPDWGWNSFTDNTVGSTLHMYDMSPGGSYTGNMFIHDNIFINNALTSINLDGSVWTNSFTVYIYKNLLVGFGSQHGSVSPGANTFGISFANLTTPIYFYNNTVIDTGRMSGTSANYLLRDFGSNENLYLQNNVFITENNENLSSVTTSSNIQTHSNNAWYDTDTVFTAPSWDTSPIITDPKLTNYIPDSDSPLVNAGADTSATVGTVDLYGIPWGATMSIGALNTNSVTSLYSQAGNIGNSTTGGSVSNIGSSTTGSSVVFH